MESMKEQSLPGCGVTIGIVFLHLTERATSEAKQPDHGWLRDPPARLSRRNPENRILSTPFHIDGLACGLGAIT
jgi:hypothetical protein